jgi:membrane-bound lytic murein transglycosylase D
VKEQLSFHQISSMLDIPEDELQYLNPSYRKRVIPVVSEEPSFLTLPSNKIGAFINNEANIYNYQKQDIYSEDNLTVREISKIHIVKKGEHLTTIAKKYGCSVSDIKTWNGIISNNLKPGKKLTVYIQDKKPAEKILVSIYPANTITPIPEATENNSIKNTSNGIQFYTIKKGDSLYKISQKYNTTVDELKRLNNFEVNYNLLPVKIIKVSAF